MTRIRPCIDLHDGKVKQIIGSTLTDDANSSNSANNNSTAAAVTVNFCSDLPPSHYTNLYRNDELTGGHVILLGNNPENKKAAMEAIHAWPGGLQVGGGVNDTNCAEWIQAGASQVIVTSYAFDQGLIHWERLELLLEKLGGLKERLVLDLSCRKKQGKYYVVTNRWQTFTDTIVDAALLEKLAEYCGEFLIHAVDVEGKQSGIQQDIVEFLGDHATIPVTYAGGVRSIQDLDLVEKLGKGKVDVTVGSALDIFGGPLSYKDVVEWHKTRNH
jgi:phosphoribosylformimino-5-aminoimidazole carboxamide ribotide isomerase